RLAAAHGEGRATQGDVVAAPEGDQFAVRLEAHGCVLCYLEAGPGRGRRRSFPHHNPYGGGVKRGFSEGGGGLPGSGRGIRGRSPLLRAAGSPPYVPPRPALPLAPLPFPRQRPPPAR